jgi:hypothetical protein
MLLMPGRPVTGCPSLVLAAGHQGTWMALHTLPQNKRKTCISRGKVLQLQTAANETEQHV